MSFRAAAAGLMVPALLAAAQAGAGSPAPPSPMMSEARSDYIEHCAGCHGIEGSSAPARVPELRGRVGYFLCTREGREYIVRLPNVAHAPLADPAALAALLNYVVFDLGGASTQGGVQAYRADEVQRLRSNPLLRTSLKRARTRLVADLRRRCPGVPASLGGYSAAAPADLRKSRGLTP